MDFLLWSTTAKERQVTITQLKRNFFFLLDKYKCSAHLFFHLEKQDSKLCPTISKHVPWFHTTIKEKKDPFVPKLKAPTCIGGWTYEMCLPAFLTVTFWSGESPLLEGSSLVQRGHMRSFSFGPRQQWPELVHCEPQNTELRVLSVSGAEESPPQEAISRPWPFTRTCLLNHLLDFLLLAMHHII